MAERGFDPAFLEEVKRRSDLAGLIGGAVAMRRKGKRWWGLCPFHGEKTPSFAVEPEKARFECFGCGARGDLFDWLQAREGLTFPEAVRHAAAAVGLDAGGAQPRPDPAAAARREAERRAREAEREREAARQARAKAKAGGAAYRAARPRDPALAIYLKSRGLDPEVYGGVPETLRFHPACPYLARPRLNLTAPAMIAPVAIEAEGRARFSGVHCTWLRDDFAGKAALSGPDGEALPAKTMHGAVWGGAVRLAPAIGRTLYLAEGIETGLAVLAFLAAAGERGTVWAALSLGNLAGRGQGQGPLKGRDPETGRWLRAPAVEPDMTARGLMPPAWAREVVICADNDAKDPDDFDRLLTRAKRRYQALGCAVRAARPPAGMDYNDWWCARGSAAAAEGK